MMKLTVVQHQRVAFNGTLAATFVAPGGTIGRNVCNHLVLPDDQRRISRLQACIRIENNLCYLRNMGSVLQVFINGQALNNGQEHRLCHGDSVKIGTYVLFAEAVSQPSINIDTTELSDSPPADVAASHHSAEEAIQTYPDTPATATQSIPSIPVTSAYPQADPATPADIVSNQNMPSSVLGDDIFDDLKLIFDTLPVDATISEEHKPSEQSVTDILTTPAKDFASLQPVQSEQQAPVDTHRQAISSSVSTDISEEDNLHAVQSTTVAKTEFALPDHLDSIESIQPIEPPSVSETDITYPQPSTDEPRRLDDEENDLPILIDQQDTTSYAEDVFHCDEPATIQSEIADPSQSDFSAETTDLLSHAPGWKDRVDLPLVISDDDQSLLADDFNADPMLISEEQDALADSMSASPIAISNTEEIISDTTTDEPLVTVQPVSEPPVHASFAQDSPLAPQPPFPLPPIPSQTEHEAQTDEQPENQSPVQAQMQPLQSAATTAQTVRSQQPTQPEASAQAPAANDANTDGITQADIDSHLQKLAEAFLEGAGITGIKRPLTLDVDTMRKIGAMLRLFTQGTIDQLSSRSIIKRGVKANMTILLDDDSNPFKLLPDSKAVLMQMFGSSMPEFMQPEVAISDAMNDLQAHQIAMVAGMRATLAEYIVQFDPHNIEKKIFISKLNLLPSGKKAKLWEGYIKHYHNASASLTDDFYAIFGPAFLKAYDAEIELLRTHIRPTR